MAILQVKNAKHKFYTLIKMVQRKNNNYKIIKLIHKIKNNKFPINRF